MAGPTPSIERESNHSKLLSSCCHHCAAERASIARHLPKQVMQAEATASKWWPAHLQALEDVLGLEQNVATTIQVTAAPATTTTSSSSIAYNHLT
jgi:hypothetical protein